MHNGVYWISGLLLLQRDISLVASGVLLRFVFTSGGLMYFGAFWPLLARLLRWHVMRCLLGWG